MATGTKNDLDNRYSPEALRDREKNNDAFDDIANNYDQTADDSQENANIEKAKDAEEKSSWRTKVTGRGVYGDKPFERGRKLSAANVQSILKKKGPVGLIITILLGGSVGLGGLFGGALAPLAFMENVTDDLNDQLAALDIRGTAMLRNKIIYNKAKDSIAGCTKLSIRCKFKTMSEKQVLRYKLAGIDVKGPGSIGLGKRIAPETYTFRGNQMTAQEFLANMKTDPSLRVAQKRALNMKFLGLNDNTFIKRTLARFGISKRPPELKGSHQERVNALMNKAGVDDPAKVTFIRALDDEGNELKDKDGKLPAYHLQGNTDGRIYSEADKKRSEKALIKVSNAKPPSRLTSNIVKGISVLGYWDLACSINKMIGAAAIAAKLATQYELAKYAMKTMSLVSQMKAGEITMENAQVVGEFFGSTDSRRQIVDLDNSVTADTKTGQITPTAEVAMTDNPDYGKNAMDSPLYQLSSSKQFNSTSLTEKQYSLGMSQNTLLSGFAHFAEISKSIVNVGGADACKFVQNWAVRGVGLIVGIVGAFFSGGQLTVAQAATSGSLIVASMVLESIINNALSGSVLSEGMSEAPLDRAAATWTGISVPLGEVAKNRGMIPGSTEQLMAYNKLQVESKNAYVAVEREGAHLFDITKQYSFLGSLGRSLLPYVSGSNSVGSTLASTLSFTTNSFSKLFTPAAYASTFDPKRFTQCGDEGYKAMGLDPDLQCNLRYILPPEELAMDTDAVAQYMETNKHVEPDTTTGVPVGYVPPSPEESQGFAMDMLNGIADTVYDNNSYGDTEEGREYGKFLYYCAYRVMPIGDTYQEEGQVNPVDSPTAEPGDRWLDGSKCIKTPDEVIRADDEMMRNFRVYTFDKSLSEAEDEDVIPVPGASPTPTATPGNGENSGNVNPNGWSFPTVAGAPLTQGYHDGHLALDIGGDPSNNDIPIYAMREGTVTSVGNMPMPPYLVACLPAGNTTQQTVIIEHNVDGQKYFSTYHHVQAGKFPVQVGSTVKSGDRIATMGNTGCSFGQHLHVELWRNSVHGGGTTEDLGKILYG